MLLSSWHNRANLEGIHNDLQSPLITFALTVCIKIRCVHEQLYLGLISPIRVDLPLFRCPGNAVFRQF